MSSHAATNKGARLAVAAVLAAGCPREGGGSGAVLEGATIDEGPREPAASSWTDLVRMVGRHERVGPGRVRYGWSGTGLRVRFHGTALWLLMDDHAWFHDVRVDGKPARRLSTHPGPRRYAVVQGLAEGEHLVEVRRRTEGHVGPTEVIDVETDGQLLPAPAPTLRMEVLGDSITAGYGNEGATRFCKYSPKTENFFRTYAGLAAAAVGAEVSAIAWSGKGVARNYGGDTKEPTLPAIYERSVPTDPGSRWLDEAPADVVVINLGTNDFSSKAAPSAEEFVAAYVAMLAAVRARHPHAPILCTVAPLLGTEERAMVESYIDRALALRRSAGDEAVERIDLNEPPRGWGCDWHPSAATHARMAERLVPRLEAVLREPSSRRSGR